MSPGRYLGQLREERSRLGVLDRQGARRLDAMALPLASRDAASLKSVEGPASERAD
jgi:hypothetical protein